MDCNDGSAFKELFANDINLLLDYITNLQEENENLKDQIEWYKQQCDDLEMQIGSEEI